MSTERGGRARGGGGGGGCVETSPLPFLSAQVVLGSLRNAAALLLQHKLCWAE